MTFSEKKQIYLDRFPAIIGKRMSDQFIGALNLKDSTPELMLILNFNVWDFTEEGHKFWNEIRMLYQNSSEIEHQQILDIFHKHNIKP